MQPHTIVCSLFYIFVYRPIVLHALQSVVHMFKLFTFIGWLISIRITHCNIQTTHTHTQDNAEQIAYLGIVLEASAILSMLAIGFILDRTKLY